MQEMRPVVAKLGITALNLFAPGVGLLRTGRAKQALTFLLIPVAWLFGAYALAALAPQIPYPAFMIFAAASLILAVLLFGGSMILSWRTGKCRGSIPWWGRWYALVSAIVLFLLAADVGTRLVHSHYKPFYLPSESMMPTLTKGDRLLAAMRVPAPVQRGDLLLVQASRGVYLKRVAAISGDRIALTRGAVWINGRRIGQRLLRREKYSGWGPVSEATRLSEQFPGEAHPHEILDTGETPVDDMPEQVVKPGHLFLLGDNRDWSADSRVSRPLGLEQVPVADVLGYPLYISWNGTGERWG